MVLNKKQSALYVVAFIIIIICMTMIYYMSAVPSEHFSNSDNASLTVYNNLMNNTTCERDFSTHINIQNVNLSDRALQLSESPGSCRVNMRSAQLSDEASYIVENNIKYALTSVCVTFKYTEMYLRNGDSMLSIVFSKVNKDDYINLMYLFMGNPVYVEFEDSVPYVPIHSSTFSNVNDKHKMIICHFRRLVNPQQNTSALFKFNNAKPIRNIFKNTINVRSSVLKPLSAKVYFLDKDNAQTTSTTMVLQNAYKTNPVIGNIKLYKRDYSITENPQSEIFFFHQRIFTMMQNGDLPVFTFSFEMLTSNDLENELSQAVEVFKVYMVHSSIGKHAESCMSNMKILENTNSNILSCIISMSSGQKKRKQYTFTASTGSRSGNNTCALNAENTLAVTLPILGGVSKLRITLTVSPVEKIALFKWTDNEGNDKFIFTRSQKCNKNNFFHQLFSQRQVGKVEANDINMSYHSKFITQLYFAELGHRHYINSFLQK